MYDTRDGQKCVKCGWKWKPTTGLIDERPTKPHDSECGQVIEEWREHNNKEPNQKIAMCHDGSNCQLNPKSMSQLDDGTWIAVCTTHNND